MKLGIFDSGLGGLLISKAVREMMPDIDMIYYGDTLHVPYGRRSAVAIYDFTVGALEFLFQQDCQLIVVACNTACAAALRKIQQEWLPAHYPDRRVLGVVAPVLEEIAARQDKEIGLMATNYVVHSNIFEEELQKIDQEISITPIAAPLLVPLLENDGGAFIDQALEKYLACVKDRKLDSIILGCTHYPLVKEHVRKLCPGAALISQDDIIPGRIQDYLDRHPEIDDLIGRNSLSEFYVSDITPGYCESAYSIYGGELPLKAVNSSEIKGVDA